MAVGPKDVPAEQPSSPEYARPEAENHLQEQNVPAQPLPTNTNTTAMRSRHSFLSTKGLIYRFDFTIHAFNVFDTGADKAVLCRRICIAGILLIQTVYFIRFFFKNRLENIVSLIFTIILGITGLFIMANWLAQIGEVSGKRIVLGQAVGRKNYDGFLASMFTIQFLIFTGVLDSAWGIIQFVLLCWAARIARNPEVEDDSIV